jgi:hypothetical protein
MYKKKKKTNQIGETPAGGTEKIYNFTSKGNQRLPFGCVKTKKEEPTRERPLIEPELHKNRLGLSAARVCASQPPSGRNLALLRSMLQVT